MNLRSMTKRWLAFFGLFVFGTGLTHAALNLELTRGTRHALPIAFIVDKSSMALEKNRQLSVIIQHDLESSGMFDVIEKKTVSRGSYGNFDDSTYWKQKKINAVLFLAYEGDGSVRVILRDVFARHGLKTSDGVVLYSQVLTMQPADWRTLAHHISDVVYTKLVGVKGYFSTRLAYVLVKRKKHTHYYLQVADVDGQRPQTLLDSPEPIVSPVWSPTGREIAYVSYEGKRQKIYIQNLKTGKRFSLPHKPGLNSAPAFSHDGKKLAVVLSWKTGHPKIWVYDLERHSYTQMTRGWWIDTEPCWSPDDRLMVFTSNRGGSAQIYQYSFDTNQVKRISYDGSYNAHPVYYPDGNGIIVMHKDRHSDGFQIAKIRLDSSGEAKVLAESMWNESPSMSPNGKMIVFASRFDNQDVLAMTSLDGFVRLRIPSDSGNVREPSWSPFL